mgnify:FL=1|jgi:hypothetical protein
MKNLTELIKPSKEDLPTIYCDMDQVLCDFIGGAEKVIGIPFAQADKEDRWKKIINTKNFWANLEWMKDAKKLYQFIARYNPKILSASSKRDVNSRPGKLKWLSKNTKIKRGDTNLVNRADKQKFATTDGKPNILIDDYKKNIIEWEAKGGIGVHHKNVSKTIGELKRLGFK